MARQCRVGKRIVKHYFFLKKLSKSSNEQQLDLVKNATDDQILAIVEICVNVLKQSFKITNKQRSKLVPHANIIRKMSRCRSAKSAKKIIQKGGGVVSLGALLAPVLFEAARFLLK